MRGGGGAATPDDDAPGAQAAWRAAHSLGRRCAPSAVDEAQEAVVASVNVAFERALRPRNAELDVGPAMVFTRCDLI